MARSRIETDIRTDRLTSILAKSRLEAESQAERIRREKIALNDSIRRSRVNAQVDSLLRQY